MNLNLFIKEMKMYRNLMVIWCLSITGMVLFGMAFYPAIAGDGFITQLTPLFESPMMKSVMVLFGVDFYSMTGLSGFYVAYTSIYATLIGCIFAIFLASKIISKEESGKTAEFLFTKPITRSQIFFSKTLVLFSMIAILNVTIIASGLIGMELFKIDGLKILNLTPSAKKEFITAFEKEPVKFREEFGLGEKDYIEFMLGGMMEQVKINPDTPEGEGMADVDINDMESLIEEMLVDPDGFLQGAKDSPERFMEMFPMPGATIEDYLKELEKSEKDFAAFKKELRDNPARYVEMFKADPGEYLGKYRQDSAALKKLGETFNIKFSSVKNLFVYYRLDRFLILSLYIFLLMLTLGSIGVLLSVLLKRGKSVTGIAIGITLAFYFVDALSGISEKTGFIGYISPYKFVNSDILAPVYALDWWRLLYFLGVTAVSTAAALFLFRKKDILI